MKLALKEVSAPEPICPWFLGLNHVGYGISRTLALVLVNKYCLPLAVNIRDQQFFMTCHHFSFYLTVQASSFSFLHPHL